MKPKILIIEDEENYIDFLRLVLEELGVTEFDTATTVEEANAAVEGTRYNLVLTDIKLKSKHEGMDIIKSLRDKDENVHILAISALGSESYKVMGLEKGADDYIYKNDSYGKLKNKIRIHLKRVQQDLDRDAPLASVKWRDITLLPDGVITAPGLEVELKFKGEGLQILRFMMTHPGVTFFGRELKCRFRQYDDLESGLKNIYSTMDRIREKFDKFGVACPIQTLPGGGYEVPR